MTDREVYVWVGRMCMHVRVEGGGGGGGERSVYVYV